MNSTKIRKFSGDSGVSLSPPFGIVFDVMWQKAQIVCLMLSFVASFSQSLSQQLGEVQSRESDPSRLGKEWRSLGCRGTAFCSLTEPLEGITTRDIETGQF